MKKKSKKKSNNKFSKQNLSNSKNFIDSTIDLTEAKKITIICFISVLILVFTANLILKPAPLEISYIAKTPSNEDIGNALKWHLINNCGVFFIENKENCSLGEKNSSTLSINCPSLKNQITLELKENNLISILNKNKKTLLNSLWKTSENNALQFLPVTFELQEIKSIKPIISLFGEELNVSVILKKKEYSSMTKQLLNLAKTDTDQLMLKEITKNFDDNINSNVIFRKNRYGYYLPVLSY